MIVKDKAAISFSPSSGL